MKLPGEKGYLIKIDPEVSTFGSSVTIANKARKFLFSLIGLLTCLCLSDSYLQNIFYHELDRDEPQWFLEIVSYFLFSHSAQST